MTKEELADSLEVCATRLPEGNLTRDAVEQIAIMLRYDVFATTGFESEVPLTDGMCHHFVIAEDGETIESITEKVKELMVKLHQHAPTIKMPDTDPDEDVEGITNPRTFYENPIFDIDTAALTDACERYVNRIDPRNFMGTRKDQEKFLRDMILEEEFAPLFTPFHRTFFDNFQHGKGILAEWPMIKKAAEIAAAHTNCHPNHPYGTYILSELGLILEQGPYVTSIQTGGTKNLSKKKMTDDLTKFLVHLVSINAKVLAERTNISYNFAATFVKGGNKTAKEALDLAKMTSVLVMRRDYPEQEERDEIGSNVEVKTGF